MAVRKIRLLKFITANKRSKINIGRYNEAARVVK
jgi:hypothetical protein